ncbi:uncharacterized protein LOC143034326 [Oratosquilla oratoria]|uniref:uncharacterized protein LOC143034326 n=1 Tax=Oratosquilla oratoria TaxID=337810 RepID=UPI003F75FB54
MYQHLSQDGKDRRGVTEDEFTLRRKLTSIQNRDRFLKDCLEEQVLPRSAPKHLHHPHKPFSNTAREYLKEARETLRNEESMIRSRLKKDHIPHGLVLKIKEEDRIQKAKLQMKLEHLCNNSRWKEVGRHELITNLSSLRLTKTQEEALSLGLKFSTGINHKTTADYVEKNYNWRDSELENGFKQGLILCCSLASRKREPAIPRRYTRALKELRDNNDILITTADKGGGIVILDKLDYVRKMEDLLSDPSTYTKQNIGKAKEEAEQFNKTTRKILKRTEKGKKMLHLLEEDPKTPTLKGLPKIHKQEIPLRPITSGIGSAPHRLAKILAKPLSSALGNISSTHLQNSTDLIEKLNNIDFSQKRLISYDVTSLFTHVSIKGAINAIKEALQTIDENSLPICKRDYMQLTEKCMRFGSFRFDNQEYHQLEGLPMGSPLSAVAANLYLEVLERDHFLKILPKGSHWLSAHDERTKTGVVIGFFLRALRICSKEFLEEEIRRVTNTFISLGYPEGLLSTSLSKAQNIRQRREPVNRQDKQYLVVPDSEFSRTLGDACVRCEITSDIKCGAKSIVQ